MKTYNELTPSQQHKAIAHFENELLQNIIEGGVRFNDELNQDDLQKRIDKAIAKAEAMKTPWFSGEYIMDTCRENIESIAQCTAEDAIYLEAGEYSLAI